jgi:predicted Rossmann fold flavoprotein
LQRNSVIIIGGGAAGLLAAGSAAETGARVLVLEKMERPGRKLLLTGKGRCNLTNRAPLEEFIDHFGRNGRFLRTAFQQFFSDDLLRLFDLMDVETVDERGGRVFTASGEASDVVKGLLRWTEELGVRIQTRSRVREILLNGNSVRGVVVQPNRILEADAVILATGGKSYPATGSTGDGYDLAAAVGHTIHPARAALVPLVTSGDLAKKLQGLSLKNVEATLLVDGRKAEFEFGEMLFTHYGLSGPIILSMSRAAVEALAENRKVEVSIDLKPALDEEKLEARLLRDFDAHGKRHFETILEDLLPRKLIPVCIECVRISPRKLANQISGIERKRLQTWLKDFRFHVVGHRGFEEAIVTAGGVDLRQVDPRAMESKLIEGLYIAGELLDLDADTGGYNLQAAFSTGWLAGRSAALKSLNRTDKP